MSSFLAKGKHFITRHVWFENSIDKKHCDYLIIHGCDERIIDGDCNVTSQETLITNLSCNKEELWSLMTKTVRNEINRSEREKVEVKIYFSKDITKDILEKFEEMYHNMYEEKGIKGHYLPLNELNEYIKDNALIVTVAEIDGQPVVYHSYIIGQNKSRFLHSCSEFRVVDNTMRNAIGRANKYLHWNDLLFLKNMGIQEYDWGGIESYENPNGIDKFKMSFGGTYKQYYNVHFVCSLRAKIYKMIRKIVRI